VYGIPQRVLRLIFDNPIIAFTMMRDDLTAGLFAPVEVLLVEHHNQEGCTVVYNPPSALVAAEDPRCYRPPGNSTTNSMRSSAARPAYRCPLRGMTTARDDRSALRPPSPSASCGILCWTPSSPFIETEPASHDPARRCAAIQCQAEQPPCREPSTFRSEPR